MSSSMELESQDDFVSFRDDYSEGYVSDDDEGDDETASITSDSSDLFFIESSYQEQIEEDRINSEGNDGDRQTNSDQSVSNYIAKEVAQRVEVALFTVTSFLSVSPDGATILLRIPKSSVQTMAICSRVANRAFRRRGVGLAMYPSSLDNRVLRDVAIALDSAQPDACPLPLETYLASRMICGYFSCEARWKGYTDHAISSKSAFLTLRCARPCYAVVVGEGVILPSSDEEDRSMPSRYKRRSSVEFQVKAKWYPARGSEYGVDYARSHRRSNPHGTVSNVVI